ncbi:unnamed protein product [Clonostachys rosea f. rosea IK726]|uniref:Beta-lactamase-related domain-containing protein n=2 Tax=Bionectria ochroleuca TaxID=29856 RepID=A0A0B7KC60_BIOOC|nr:unnamed protein product [Clonostachys rosea f. rosea IK726]
MSISFQQALSKHTAPDAQGVFGAVAAVADNTGKLVMTSAGGRRTWVGNEEPDLDTTNWAYSFTKLFTTIAVLQCVERGKIHLDDTVYQLLPELEDVHVINPADDGAGFALRLAENSITFRHLLTHTSGSTYDNFHPLLIAWRQSRGESSLAMCGDVVKGYSMPLVFEPGESWSYGGGLDWAGLAIERLTGQRLGEYMRQNIFVPLGLTHTTFNISQHPEAERNLMDMSIRVPSGELAFMENLYPRDATGDSGGMGIVTSAGDFIKVVADLIKEKPVLLSPAMADSMFRPQFGAESKQAKGLLAMSHLYDNITGGERRLGALSFGLGGLVAVEDTPSLPAGTLAWNGMPNMGWFANKELGVAAVFACQMMPPGDAKSTDLLTTFAQEIWKYKRSS